MRLAWADPHGASRAKAVTVPAFIAALDGGYNINVATTTLDSANARTFASFTRGGGMGLDEMTGSPNLTIVPDPATFRVLPWAPGVGWMLCDEYFNSGVPFHFSPRHLLRRQLRRLARAGAWACVVGLEVEWYLLRVVAGAADRREHRRARACAGARSRPVPPEPGYSYHSESNMDLMQPVLSALAEAFEKIGLPLRSVENEWGPGQVECTFAAARRAHRRRQPAAVPHRDAADLPAHGLFRDLHVPARRSRATTRAAGICTSRWSTRRAGRNLFMPERAGDVLSPLGRNFVGGLAAARRAGDRVRDADRQRLSPLPAELARARPRDLVLRPSRRHDPRARRRRAIRRRGSRTASASRPPIPISS